MTFIKRKWCRRRHSNNCAMLLHTTAMLAVVVAAILTSLTTVACAKLETQIKLLINDEALLLEQAKQHPPHVEPHHHTHSQQLETAAAASAPRNAEEQQHYEMYRSSDLRRLSYETIHRILRDENEPMYRREDAEMRYYQKRSDQPTHEIFRRAADDEQPPVHLLNFTHANLTDLALINSVNVTEVRMLDVSHNRLTAVNLSRFAQLQHADLANNLLTALPATNRELKLTTLNANGNLINGGTPTAFYQHLHELHLSANRIVNLISLNLSALNGLEILDLSCNQIENLETAFFPQRMHNLKFLNLANNRLSSIYRETFYNLLSLNTLILTHNNITDIDYETFLALPNLQYLDLSHNQLHGESIRALQGIPDLVGLSIAHNPELGGYMQEFVASWSLKELDASGTGLCQIPAALAQSVRTLKLSDNWLKIINCGDLDSYPLLQYLDLSQSRIEDIEDDALGRLEILEVLFLDHNSLHSVPISLPTSLQHLFLQHNEIMDIQLQAFQGLNQLQTLDLSGNKLLYLPALALPKLLTLNIQSSELRGLNQAIVNTLPRLRDMLLEDNPIKCSDLLGIAEWASPCRISDRAVSNSVLPTAETIEEELGQFQSKIDLKQQFVQMHNFLEKFKSNCAQQWSVVAAPATIPPICAIEMDAETETSTVEEVEFIMESNLPTEPEIQARANSNNNNEKLYDNQSANLAKSLQQSAQNNDTANAEEANATEMSAAVTAATIISTRSNTPTKNNSSSSSSSKGKGKVLTMHAATDKSFAAAAVVGAVPVTSKSILVATKENIKEKLPTVKSTTIALAAGSSKLPATTTATSAATIAANQYELHIEETTIIINAKRGASKTTTAATATPTPTTIVINSTTATTKKEIPSTSSLNNSVVFAVAKTENVDTTTVATTTTTETMITSVAAAVAMEKTPMKTTTVTIHVLPQTISAMIKSDNNNYVETTSSSGSSSLLSQQGLKTPTAVTTLAVAAARVDKAKNDSDSDSNSNVSLSSNRQQLNFNGISGQQHIGTMPTTTQNIILANQQHQQQLQLQQQYASNITTTHRHEPLQLHIKNRHLIGTPLLMHKGHNILVETEQFMLPTSTTTTTTTAAAMLRTADNPIKAMEEPATAAKRSKAGKLAKSQNIQELIEEPRHFLAGNSDNLQQQQKTEAIFAETNGQTNENPVKFADITDMRSLPPPPGTTEIINTKTTNAVADDDTNKKVNRVITKMPRILTDKKKKLSLTMKKMTITKHAGAPSQQSLTTSKHQHQHQSLNTPRENEAAMPLSGSNRDGDLVDWQIFKEIKTEQNFIEPKPQPSLPHKHSASVNTPTNSVVQQHFPQHELPQLSAVEQQLLPENSLSKSEQLLDVRKNTTSAGHPGLVILISLIAFIVLLVGLVQVYRCDKPWRQQLALQQRPHQLSRIGGDLTGEDGFLSYQQQRQPNPAQQKWHHSTRLLPPHCSPLHNLHVRELQQISVAEHRRQTTGRYKKSFPQALNLSTTSGSISNSSSTSSYTSNSHYSSTGAIMEDDAFYIEMTPDSGHPAASSQHLHSDLLPMELLSSTATAASSTNQQNLMDATELDATTNEQQQQVASASIAPPPVLPLFSGESTATFHNKTSSDKRLPVVNALTPTTRKFGLW